jgi:hypothetical protein
MDMLQGGAYHEHVRNLQAHLCNKHPRLNYALAAKSQPHTQHGSHATKLVTMEAYFRTVQEGRPSAGSNGTVLNRTTDMETIAAHGSSTKLRPAQAEREE